MVRYLYESYELEKDLPDNANFDDYESLSKFRKWFKAAVENWSDWRNEALEDYKFVTGEQWTAEELREFAKQKRPALVINRIKPLINILSGWQRLNRYDVNFLPRTAEDVQLCEVRKGMTKYIFDRCNYETRESTSFVDCAIGGIGWFGVKYKFDAEINDGEAMIERIDPFSIYADPEAHELDFSDAKFICRAKWADKEELQNLFPDKAEMIENNFNLYDPIEKQNQEQIEINPLWYSSELKKVRVIECWYKQQENVTAIYTADGQSIIFDEENREQVLQLMMTGAVADYKDISVTKVKVCTFFDKTLLEDIESPYKHGEFPYVPMIYHYYGVGDTPAGFVRALKDPQREINKRRIQELHILNNSANSGGFVEEGAMTPEQFAEFEEKNSEPGHYNSVLSIEKIREREPKKQAVTHLSTIFDALRTAKKKIAYLLWGKRGKPGIIPQFYTADKIYRIEGENGFEFIHANQQVQDPLTGAIVKTLNDLSVGEFDIVIDDVEATATKRVADFYSLVDAGSKLGLPPQIMIQPVLEYLDIPKRDEIMAKYQQMLQEQAQAQQAERDLKLKIEEIKNQDSRQIITFKDAPFPIQMAMAAKAGIVPQEFANDLMRKMIEQFAPETAMQMQQQAQQAQAQQMQAQQQPQQAQQVPPALIPTLEQQQNINHQQPKTMTDAAAKSVMSGMSPAAV